MGIYDRDYQRDNYQGNRPRNLGSDWSMTTWLIVINVGVYVLQHLLSGLTDHFVMLEHWYHRPWEIYRLLTSGFLHSPDDLKHILFNMIALFFFGRAVEMRYGSREMLALYLVAIVFSSVVWDVTELMVPNEQQVTPQGVVTIEAAALGASGAISALLVLFILNFPRQSVYVWGILELPAWVFGIIFIGMDIVGAISRSGNIAFTAHLGGALFAFLYYRNGWRLARFIPTQIHMPKFGMGPKLKVHSPDDDRPRSMEKEVDRILKKINDEGQDSLTTKERKTLEQASRKFQQRNTR